jgi:hypothetical protein
MSKYPEYGLGNDFSCHQAKLVVVCNENNEGKQHLHEVVPDLFSV